MSIFNKITVLKDRLGNKIIPMTLTKAVQDDNGVKLDSIINNIDTNINEVDKNIGDISTLQTVDKTNLVNAINELKRNGGGGGATLNVFKSTGGSWGEYTAQEQTNTFTIENYNGTKKSVDLYYESVLLIPGKLYSINSTGEVTLAFQLDVGETIDYCVNDVSFDYNELANKPNFPVCFKTLNLADLDTVVDLGEYYGYGLTNTPSGVGTAGYYKVYKHHESIKTYVIQDYIPFGTGVKYTRNLVNGVWQPWQQIATTQMLDDRGYLNAKVLHSSIAAEATKSGKYIVANTCTDKPPLSGTRIYTCDVTFERDGYGTMMLREYSTGSTIWVNDVKNGVLQTWQRIATTDDIISNLNSFKTSTMTIKGLPSNNLYEARENGVYLTGGDITDLPDGWAQGRKVLVTFNTGNINYSSQLLMPYNAATAEKKIAFRTNLIEGSKWFELATTNKTSFVCTANTNITLTHQSNYMSNGEFFIGLRAQKTDGSAFAIGASAIAINAVTPKATVVGSAMGRTDTSTAQWLQPINCYADGAKNIVVSVPVSGIKEVYVAISGVIA